MTVVSSEHSAPGLTDAHRERIRLEEVFREEVRRSLDQSKRKTGASRAVAFLNTPLGLWFLSTIAIGVFVWTYGAITEYRRERAQRSERIAQLTSEIAYRMEHILAGIEQLGIAVTTAQRELNLTNIRDSRSFHDELDAASKDGFAYTAVKSARDDLLRTIRQQPAADFPPLHPELARYNLAGLLRDLHNELQKDDRIESARRVRTFRNHVMYYQVNQDPTLLFLPRDAFRLSMSVTRSVKDEILYPCIRSEPTCHELFTRMGK